MKSTKIAGRLVATRLDVDLLARLETLCKELELSEYVLVRAAVAEYLDKVESRSLTASLTAAADKMVGAAELLPIILEKLGALEGRLDAVATDVKQIRGVLGDAA